MAMIAMMAPAAISETTINEIHPPPRPHSRPDAPENRGWQHQDKKARERFRLIEGSPKMTSRRRRLIEVQAKLVVADERCRRGRRLPLGRWQTKL